MFGADLLGGAVAEESSHPPPEQTIDGAASDV